jgi:cell division protein ZapA (FtsZ GTPase activity inhibitor)
MPRRNSPAQKEVIVEVNLLGLQHQIACKAAERNALEQSIQELTKRAELLKEKYQLRSTESVLLMLCLNMTLELGETQDLKSAVLMHQDAVSSMCDKIDRVMENAPEQLTIL